MDRRLIFTFLLTLIYLQAFSQEVLWADKVLEKSSETIDENSSPKYRAIQALGPPSVLPQAISSPTSWRPTGTTFGEDYIKVGFEKAIKVRQIIIGETVGPGAIGRIFGYTKDNKEVLLFQNPGQNLRPRPGIWNEMIPETEQEIIAIKLLIVHSLNRGPKEYDCIGISNSTEPFVAKINVAEDLPEDLERINLGPNINSRYSEVAPLVSPDGKSLYFTRLNHPKNYVPSKLRKEYNAGETNLDVWVSKLNDHGDWGPATNMKKSIHESLKNAAATIAMDGNSIYALNAMSPAGGYEAGLTKVSLKNSEWTNRETIYIENFEALSYYNTADKARKKETEFAMSSDGKFLVMGLVRRDSYGDKDLYVSFRKEDNTYSKPLNLGPIINTAGNEGTPFLAADNKTLYFNSNGHPGYGDMDIFMTTRLDDTWTNWSRPVNLGPKINSPDFDGYISIPASGEYAYFSSSQGSLGSDDIFKIKLFPSIQPEAVVIYDFTFVDEHTQEKLNPNIQFVNLEHPEDENNQVDFIFDTETNSYKTVLPINSSYQIKAALEGYKDLSSEINLNSVKEYMEIQKIYILNKIPEEPEIVEGLVQTIPDTHTSEMTDKTPIVEEELDELDKIPLEAGQNLILKEVYFDQSKADLRRESFVQLEKIRKLMIENPNMEILLEGHTDNQGDADLNFWLAEQRIKNVKSYITRDGLIDSDRITVKSWGQYRPLVNNSNEEARMKNRRVEFTIIKI